MRLALTFCFMAAIVSAEAKLTPVDQTSFAKMVATHKGKIVLVDFWATWCVPCRKEMPELVKMSERLRAKGLDFVTVSSDEAGKEQAAFKVLMENAVAAPFYLKKVDDDDKFFESVDTKWSGEIPAMFIYDRSGKRVRSFLGETPVKDIEAAVQKLLP
jgi:thiol-disulfide isomerase/thioredoxin